MTMPSYESGREVTVTLPKPSYRDYEFGRETNIKLPEPIERSTPSTKRAGWSDIEANAVNRTLLWRKATGGTTVIVNMNLSEARTIGLALLTAAHTKTAREDK
jgi:hypothetical protein